MPGQAEVTREAPEAMGAGFESHIANSAATAVLEWEAREPIFALPEGHLAEKIGWFGNAEVFWLGTDSIGEDGQNTMYMG